MSGHRSSPIPCLFCRCPAAPAEKRQAALAQIIFTWKISEENRDLSQISTFLELLANTNFRKYENATLFSRRPVEGAERYLQAVGRTLRLPLVNL
jgi:hypothetical protein